MQVIIRIKCTPELYSVAQRHCTMSPPKKCPNCGRHGSLVALGYYQRWLSGLNARILLISIRRFRCLICGRTVSLLPDFAQPYRLVCNETIERYFAGDLYRADVESWKELLACYWKRFASWLPELRHAVAQRFGRAPPARRPQKWWSFLMSAGGNLAQITRRLVVEERVTIFGRYQCHRPNPTEGVHRPN